MGDLLVAQTNQSKSVIDFVQDKYAYVSDISSSKSEIEVSKVVSLEKQNLISAS